MVEIIYRIYEVAAPDVQESNRQQLLDFSIYGSSRSANIELLMDCCVCESRDHFKQIIRDTYGSDIAFRLNKTAAVGSLYCIIIGEHCYTVEKYFNKVKYNCDNCNSLVETYYGRPIKMSDSEIRNNLYGIEGYAEKRFCCFACKGAYMERERRRIAPNDDDHFFVTRDMFTETVAGYIYKITKKSTGEFYIGQTQYAPMFRWAEHMKTLRFPISGILDYQFEVLEIVPKGENILEVEKRWIQNMYKENPQLSLNIAQTEKFRKAE